MEKCFSTQQNVKQPTKTATKLNRNQLKQKVQNAGWKIKVDQNRMEDKTITYVYRKSKESLGQYGYTIRPLMAFVRISDDIYPGVVVETGQIGVDPTQHEFKIRVDNNPYFKVRGQPRLQGGYSIVFGNTFPAKLLKQILEGNEILVEVPTLTSGREYLSWSLKGSSAVFEYIFPELIHLIDEALKR